jgi:murein DD-endopeptidase MepM/ murein hydrolase activator NlpD
MTMRTSDRLFPGKGNGRGTVAQALAYAKQRGSVDPKDRPGFLEAFFRQLHALCDEFGADFSVLVADSNQETGWWSKMRTHLGGESIWWLFGNPAAMGYPDDPNSREPHDFKTGEEAAEIFFAHMALYNFGPDHLPAGLKALQSKNFRHDNYLAAYGRTAKAQTIQGLEMSWAWSPDHAEGVVARGNAMFPDLPDQKSVDVVVGPIVADPIAVMWGGYKWWMAQEFGPTAFARSTNLYAYGTAYCLNGHEHPGEDWAAPAGTPMFNPFADGTATVVVAGGTQYYTYYQNDYAKQQGHLEVAFKDGSRFIFGHQKSITVRVGDVLKYGQPIGTSGGEGGAVGTADHCHGEAREMKNGRLCCVPPRPFILARAGKTVEPPTKPTTPVPSGKRLWTIPGLPKPIALSDWIEVEINLVPIRPPQRTGSPLQHPIVTVQHGTGNPGNDSARQEAQGWFINQMGGSQRVLVHACGDDAGIVITCPLNEKGVHAGSNDGNNRGIAYEMMEATAIWTNPTRSRKTTLIAAEVMGAIDAQFDDQGDKLHANFGNPGCPNKVRNTRTPKGNTYYDEVYKPVYYATRDAENQRLAGVKPPPAPHPEPPPPRPAPEPKPGPTPRPNPIPPQTQRALDKAERLGFTLAILRTQFGTRVDGYAFDVYGHISLVWLEDGLKDGEYPALIKVENNDDDDRWFWFEGGAGYHWNGTEARRLRVVAEAAAADSVPARVVLTEQPKLERTGPGMVVVAEGVPARSSKAARKRAQWTRIG